MVPMKEKVKKSKGGIIMVDAPGEQKKEVFQAFIHSFGNKVKVMELDFKVGDLVVFNDYDIKNIEDSNHQVWAITKPESIMAKYEESEDDDS